MVADAMPSTLVIEADQRFLSDGLDRASVIVHGRNAHENQPQSSQRRRLCDPQDWVNCRRSQPAAGAAVESCRSFPGEGDRDPWRLALEQLRSWVAPKSSVSFCPRYDVFHLSRVAGLRLSGGRPVFLQVPQFSAEAVLASSKLTPTAQLPLDVARGVTLSTWFRQGIQAAA